MPKNAKGVPQYKVNDIDASGCTVTYIYNSRDDYIVYQGQKDIGHSVGYDLTPVLAAASIQVFSLFNKLASRTAFVPRRYRLLVQHQLATALCTALDGASQGKVDADEFFSEAKHQIDEYGRQSARNVYAISTILSAALATTLIVAALDYKLFEGTILALLLRGAICGAIGALFSALFLSRSMPIENYYYSETSFRLQGFSRILIWLIAGGVTIAAVESKLMLGFASSSAYLTAILCVASGFFEHRVPMLLENVVRQQSGNPPASGGSTATVGTGKTATNTPAPPVIAAPGTATPTARRTNPAERAELLERQS